MYGYALNGSISERSDARNGLIQESSVERILMPRLDPPTVPGNFYEIEFLGDRSWASSKLIIARLLVEQGQDGIQIRKLPNKGSKRIKLNISLNGAAQRRFGQALVTPEAVAIRAAQKGSVNECEEGLCFTDWDEDTVTRIRALAVKRNSTFHVMMARLTKNRRVKAAHWDLAKEAEWGYKELLPDESFLSAHVLEELLRPAVQRILSEKEARRVEEKLAKKGRIFERGKDEEADKTWLQVEIVGSEWKVNTDLTVARMLEEKRENVQIDILQQEPRTARDGKTVRTATITMSPEAHQLFLQIIRLNEYRAIRAASRGEVESARKFLSVSPFDQATSRRLQAHAWRVLSYRNVAALNVPIERKREIYALQTVAQETFTDMLGDNPPITPKEIGEFLAPIVEKVIKDRGTAPKDV